MASVNFLAAFNFTVKVEGGFILSTLKHDSGKQTFAGISRVKQPDWAGWALIDAGDTTSETLKRLVQTFYFNRFWIRTGFEALPQKIAMLAFDFSVNSGDGTAVKKLQEIVGVNVDGALGAQTVARVVTRDAKDLAMLYLMARLDYLDSLDAWQFFSRGWSARVVAIGRAVAQ